MQAAFQYLNPAVAASSALFRELNRNTGDFTNFITKTGNLVSDVATRSSDLSGLVSHLSTTTQALANQRVALGQSLQRLPGFMRLANTTFVNLRSALDDLKPLVDDSKPVAPKLQKLLVQLRPLARNSVPTLNDLSDIIHRPGADNDLIELTKLGVPLSAATVKNINANGQTRPGAFPESTTALNDSTPELATARPYAVDLTGWFEGYTHPGTIDANGGSSRIAPVIGVGSVENGALNLLPVVHRPDAAQRPRLRRAGRRHRQRPAPTPATPRAFSSPARAIAARARWSAGRSTTRRAGSPATPSEIPTGK